MAQKKALEEKAIREASEIKAKAQEGIKALESEDASLSDMKTFLKATREQKTSADLEKEAKELELRKMQE